MKHFYNAQLTIKYNDAPVVEHRTFSFEIDELNIFSIGTIIFEKIHLEAFKICRELSIPYSQDVSLNTGVVVHLESLSYSFVLE